MRKTKLLALLLVVAMIASMVVPSVSAAGDYTLSIVDKTTGAATINANAGDTIDVYVTISDNPGVSCVAFDVSVPEGWSIKATQNQKLFMGDSADQAGSDNYTVGPNKDFHLWLMATGTQGDDFEGIAGGKLLTQNGNLVLIRYQIPAEAQSGEYTLSVIPDLVNCFYYNVDSNGYIAFGTGNTKQVPATQSLTVNVTGTEPAGTACPEHTDVTTWTDVAEGAWNAGGTLAAGHYKLTGNQAPTSALTIAAGADVCVDLNGYNIEVARTVDSKNRATKNLRVFENSGNLVVLDASEDGTGKIAGGAAYTSSNTRVEANGGNIYNYAGATFTLCSGTVSGGMATTSGNYLSVCYGGNIYGEANTTINIKGGKVTGGVVTKNGSRPNEHIGGGNICGDGIVNISGGEVSDGYVYFDLATDRVNRQSLLSGGNIIVRDGATLNITGGKISDGEVSGSYSSTGATKMDTGWSEAFGGNIRGMVGSAITISGGQIIGGVCEMDTAGSATGTKAPSDSRPQGGNIYVSGTLTITGGTISNGKVFGSAGAHANNTSTEKAVLNAKGGNIYIDKTGVVTMSGGTVTGGRAEGNSDTANTSHSYGGNVFVVGDGSFAMTGGEVSNGYAYYRGGNIASYAVATLSGTAVVMGGYTSNYSTACAGDNIVVITAAATVTINDGAQVLTGELPEGVSSTSSIYAITNANIVINGGKVEGEIWAAGTEDNPNATLTINGGEVDTFGKGNVVPAANVVIGNGVTSKSSPVKYMTGEAAVLAGEKYTTYATLAAALAAAQADSTVSLAKDATAGAVAVPAGVTLDLNGKTLTADSVTAAFNETHVVDSKGTGKIDSDSVSLMSNNEQLAVHHEGNVTLETLELAEDLAINGTTGLYKFFIKNEAAATMLDDAIKAGQDVSLLVRVTWTKGGVEKVKDFACSNTLLQEYASNWDEKMFTLTFSDLTDIENLACTVMVTSGGVTVEA